MPSLTRSVQAVAVGWMLLLLAFAFGRAYGQEQAVVKQLDIKGSRKIDEATIRFRLKTKLGEPFSLEKTREDVKALYRLGFFDDVAVDAEVFEGGLKLTFILTEKPTIREIKIRGNKQIATDKIKEKIALTEGGVFNPQVVASNAERARLLYEEEGYYQAKVVPQVEKVSEGDVSVVFQIDEGGKFEISSVRILGTKGLSERDIKDHLATKELFLFFFYGTLKREELQRDLDRIKAFYLDNGFLDIKVDEPEIRVLEAKRRLEISIRVEEGLQYRVGEVRLAGNTVFATDEILRPLQIAKRGIFSREVFQRDILTLTDRYSERGYLFADIAPIINTDRVNHIVDLGLEISEGKQVFVERIGISGNTKTRDKVIRRDIALIEGDLYNSRLLARSRQNLNNLGYFEEVKIDTSRGTAEDRVDIGVTVKEKPTGSFSIGAGFSSIDGVLGAGSISQSNFLGLGTRLSFSGQLGSSASRYVLRYQDPHVLDTETSLDLSLFNQQLLFQDSLGYDQDAKGGSLTLGRRLYKELFGSVYYRYEQVEITNLSAELIAANLAAILVGSTPQIVPGTTTTGSVGFGLSLDLRDNRRDPTHGFVGTTGYQLSAEFLGGDNEFNKFIVDVGYYYPLFWKFVGHIRGNLAIVEPFGDKPIPAQELLYLGGTNTVRGFENFQLIPADAFGNHLGGNRAIFFNFELLFPIYEALGVKGVLFFDAGQVLLEGQSLSLDLRPAAGGGLRVATPFGLVRVEYGFNLDPLPGEESGVVHLTVGSVF